MRATWRGAKTRAVLVAMAIIRVMWRGALATSVLAAVAGWSACATPYQPMGFLGGYRDTEIGSGRYVVVIKVNRSTEPGTALEYLHRRAGELCPGGYDLDGTQRDADVSYHLTAANTVDRSSGSEITATVECRRPAPSPSTPRTYYCTWAPRDSTIGECVTTSPACQVAQRRVTTAGGDATSCQEFEFATCFAYERGGRRVGRCAPTLGSCERRRQADVAESRPVTACVPVAAGDDMLDVPIGPSAGP